MNNMITYFEDYHRTVDEINTAYNNCSINIKKIELNLIITIKGSNQDEMQDTEILLEDLIYVYWGCYPKLISQTYNESNIDIKERSSKFFTHREFIDKTVLSICDINDQSVNDKILNGFDGLNKLFLSSMQYITCSNYSKVTSTHKLVLLTHAIDGAYNAIKKEMAIILQRLNGCVIIIFF